MLTIAGVEVTDAESRVLVAIYRESGCSGSVSVNATRLARAARLATGAQLSRVTASLVDKGLLNKKRMGQFGRVRYRLENVHDVKVFHAEHVLTLVSEMAGAVSA